MIAPTNDDTETRAHQEHKKKRSYSYEHTKPGSAHRAHKNESLIFIITSNKKLIHNENARIGGAESRVSRQMKKKQGKKALGRFCFDHRV